MAAIVKAFNVLFVRVVVDGKKTNRFEELVIPKIHAATLEERRVKWGEHFLRVEGMTHLKGEWGADVVKLSPDMVQMKGRIDVDGTEVIELDEDEVLAHETAIRFSPHEDPKLSVLTVQRNHFGAGLGALEHLLSNFGVPVRLIPIVGAGRTARLKRIHQPRSITYELDIGAMQTAKAGGSIMTGIESAARSVHAQQAVVTLKVRKRKDQLSRLERAVDELLTPTLEPYVRSLRVKGIDEGMDRVTLIDLLEPNVVRRVSVKVASDGSVSLSARLEALNDALESADNELD